MILRITFNYNDAGLKLSSARKDAKLYDPLGYSGNHIVIIENQLNTPPSLNLIDNSF